MADNKRIKTALISVFHKDGLDEMLALLNDSGVKFLSTGGTKSFIESLGYQCEAVEDLTGYPSILGGRVKTLHPKVFGGILNRRDNEGDRQQTAQYEIPETDPVLVELIRAAAKNFNDVVIVASKKQYAPLCEVLKAHGCAETTLAERRAFARDAFSVSSSYDSAIFNYFDGDDNTALRHAVDGKMHLRYGENPHQNAVFFGDFGKMFDQLHGKEISYNNLLDIDAAVNLINDFDEPTFAILKHNNACGVATRGTIAEAWRDALAGDPVSAFGGVLIANGEIDRETAEEINKIFFEVVIAPSYTDEALDVLKQKKNRIILVRKPAELPTTQIRTALCGVLRQDKDLRRETVDDLRQATTTAITAEQADDLLFANKIVKHSKSNAIVLARNRQLYASGIGQTSRVDALRQAIAKARSFGFDLNGAVMASDAFFPFADCVEIAHEAGIAAVIQPGGSIRDNDTIDYCNKNGIAMVMTGIRHFKH